MQTSLQLLAPMGEVANAVGNPIKAAGWYGPTTGLHTVSLRVLNFQGRISIQASLATLPMEADWYSVLPENAAYWQYPFNNQPPAFTSGETSNRWFNFSTNAVWIRAVVDRSYMAGADLFSPLQWSYLGTVDSILLNY